MVGKLNFTKNCSVDNCDKPPRSSGAIYCDMHYSRIRRRGNTDKFTKRKSRTTKSCSVNGCHEKHCALGYCADHYRRYKRHGDPLVVRYTGNGYITSRGYKELYISGKRIKEHTIVMERKLGRKLLPNENVHHINGVKTDNRPENLELWVKSQPSGQRAKDLLEWAKQIIALYDGKIIE